MTSNSSVEAIFVKFESIRSGGVGINSKKNSLCPQILNCSGFCKS